ncbi:MAG: S8 family serine peptidase [Pseudomonadota bacterium]
MTHSNRLPGRSRALTMGLAALWTCTAGAVATETAKQDALSEARSEDGLPYLLMSDADDSAAARSSWQDRKIHPDVSARAFSDDEVRVLIYLYAQDAGRASRVANTKAAFKAELDVMAKDIRTIERKYRPTQSLPPEEEAAVVSGMFGRMSDGDKDEIKRLQTAMDKKLDEMRRAVDAEIPSRTSALGANVMRTITQGGGTVHADLPLMNAISATMSASVLDQIGKLDAVATVMLDSETEYELDVSMSSVGFPTWWNASTPLDGGIYDAAVIDSGVQQDHPNLSPNVFYTNSGSTTDSDGHGTHVAGIIASTHSQHTGGAYGLDALIWGRSSSNQSTTMSNMHYAGATAPQTAEALNHSLGYGEASTSDYTANDSFYDAFIQTYDVSVAKSAGNRSWSDTGPTITHPATAYNLLAVANMNDRGTTNRADDVRSSSSSVGPTVSNRRKPDISAPGTNIMSTNNTWAGAASGNTDPNCWSDTSRDGDNFQRCSGTSMAAPHVTAAGVLLNEAGVYDPMIQKAILINTADAWDSNDTSTTSDDGPVAGSLWDKSYGWGYLDMAESHFNRTDYFTGSVVPRNDTSTDDDYQLYRGTMFTNEKATLVWEKRAGTYVAGAPSTSQYSLADINIRLYDNANGDDIDSDLDGNDNVHQVATDRSIDAVVKVYSWSTSFSGATEEDYALATEENFEAVSPPSFTRAYSRPNWVGPYQTFDITVHMDNNGGVGAHNNTVGLNNIAGVTVNGGLNRTVPTIESGERESTPYSLTTSGIGAGTHWIPLQFVSNSYAESYNYSTAQGVSIRVETTAPVSTCPALPTYSRGSTIPVNFSATDTQTGVRTAYLYVRTPGSGSFVYTGMSSDSASGSFNYFPSGGDGAYRFAIRAVDRGGNWESVPTATECSTFLDRATPSSNVNTPNIDTSGAIPMSYSVSDPSPSSGLEFVDLWYREDGDATWSYTGQFATSTNGVLNFTPPADGTYHFFSRAKDRAQNIEGFEPNSSVGDSTTTYDTQAPTGNVSINTGAASTVSPIVNLSLSASDAGSGVELVRFSNNNSTWSPWQAYVTSVPGYDLAALGGSTTPGIKKVYVQFRDGVGRVSATYTDTIELIDGTDSDGDGIIDAEDNCTLEPNPEQRDTDGDGYGNVCDADLNNDGVVNVIDLGQLRARFFSTDADADFNGDGIVNFVDLGILRSRFFTAPGPSGIAP